MFCPKNRSLRLGIKGSLLRPFLQPAKPPVIIALQLKSEDLEMDKNIFQIDRASNDSLDPAPAADAVHELSDVHLALIGGGAGDTIWPS